ncbi:TetR/AcrR family transcriptional regulator [Streptomyces sp. NPDC017979]|uniref:TetR/AcrR family transcriptional regulator n=1 Tax=unclassified Streptomyces TaxID=2593676 RepID=UPI0037B00385
MARPRKFDETRAVGSAMDAFWRRGYRATSTRDLSESTGIGPSSLYNTFGDKRQLYLRSLRQYFDTRTVAQTAALRAAGSPRARIREMMADAVDLDLAGTGPAGCFSIKALIEMGHSDPDVDAELARHFGAVEEALRETVADGQAAGEFAPDGDPVVLARRVMSTYYGLRVLVRIHQDREALLDVVDSALDALGPTATR